MSCKGEETMIIVARETCSFPKYFAYTKTSEYSVLGEVGMGRNIVCRYIRICTVFREYVHGYVYTKRKTQKSLPHGSLKSLSVLVAHGQKIIVVVISEEMRSGSIVTSLGLIITNKTAVGWGRKGMTVET